MSDFGSPRQIKACRKSHRCEQCGREIDAGQPAFRFAYVYEGEFGSYHVHPECQIAASQYAKRNDLWDEDWPWFQHMETEYSDRQWMRETHPVVAERLGWHLMDKDDDE